MAVTEETQPALVVKKSSKKSKKKSLDGTKKSEHAVEANASNDEDAPSSKLVSGDGTRSPDAGQVKRKRKADSAITPSKKRKQDNSDTSLATQTESNGKTDHPSLNPALEPSKTIKKKKSVTFTADTILEDKETARSVPLTPAKPNDNSSQTDGTTQPAEKTEKKVKVRRPKTDLKDKDLLPYVVYLDQFHTNKAQWKFNKAKQNDLLKNLYNLYRVPQNFDDALVEYVKGLQGQGARARLAEEARKVITDDSEATRKRLTDAGVADAMPMTTVEEREAAAARSYEKWREAKRQANQLDEAAEIELRAEEQRRNAQVKRAARLMVEALSIELGYDPAEKLKATGLQPKRKRKARVDVESSDSDSSDSDSSDDSSDSDSSSDSSDDSSDSSDSDSSDTSASDSSSESSDSDSSSGSSDSDSSASSSAKKHKGAVFDKAFLDRVRPSQDKSRFKARAAELRAAAARKSS